MREPPVPTKLRLFVAADVDDGARAACAHVAEQLRETGWPGRWVPPANYHLTVAFLGGVGEERVADVIAALRDATTGARSFEIVLDTAGAFPNERRPRVVWVGPRAPVPAFAALCGNVRGALTPLGFGFDAHADAHVTLARAAGPTTALPRVDAPRIAPQRITALRLYRSFTTRAGARYERLADVPFDARGSPVSGAPADPA